MAWGRGELTPLSSASPWMFHPDDHQIDFAPGGVEHRAVSAPPASGGRLEHVSGAAQGVDHRRPARVDLLAQVADVDLHHVGLATEVVAPDPVEDLRLGQDPARGAD